ncbi:DUF6241 domain-containing protein [Salinicoccus sp. HZC-1]|uniref:DUF6241 domain-containing protein n=1 Tax=Salinicoccus sp. HZC-1 TaxID=3385497 RepID=UPI00398A6043
MKKVFMIAAAVLVITLGMAGVAFFIFPVAEEPEEQAKEPLELSGPNDSEIHQLAEGQQMFEVSDLPADGLMSEQEFSEHLHHMTHQKVRAAEKWGHRQITDERIEEKLQIARESTYEYKDFYIETLEAWQSGDFSNAVTVHNVIWNARDGTVGKATGLMTEEEEAAYIKEHFE